MKETQLVTLMEWFSHCPVQIFSMYPAWQPSQNREFFLHVWQLVRLQVTEEQTLFESVKLDRHRKHVPSAAQYKQLGTLHVSFVHEAPPLSSEYPTRHVRHPVLPQVSQSVMRLQLALSAMHSVLSKVGL